MCKKLLLMCRQNLQNLNLRHSQKKSWLAKTLFFKLPTFHPYSTLEPSITEIKFLLYHAAFCRMKNRRLSFRPNKARRALTFFLHFCIQSKKSLMDLKLFLLCSRKKGAKLARLRIQFHSKQSSKNVKYVRNK